jgi:hypothetical protein
MDGGSRVSTSQVSAPSQSGPNYELRVTRSKFIQFLRTFSAGTKRSVQADQNEYHERLKANYQSGLSSETHTSFALQK